MGSPASSRARLSGLRPSSPTWTPGPVCSDYCLLCAQHVRPTGGPGQAEQPRTQGESHQCAGWPLSACDPVRPPGGCPQVRQTALSQPGPRGPHSHPARLTGASPLAKSLQGLHSGTRSRPEWSQQAPALTSTESDIPEASHLFFNLRKTENIFEIFFF